MAIVHAVGQPENESERRAIAYFRDHLPGDDYVIFHNLELRAGRVPSEYDLIIIGEHGVYPIEVKSYHGTIRGNAKDWEFDNGLILPSPLPRASNKARILQSRLERDSPALEKVFVAPTLIVLTDDRARVELDDPEKSRVLHLDEAVDYILNTRADSITQHTDRICRVLFHQFRPLRRENEIGDYSVLELISRNQLYATYLAKNKLIQSPGRFALKVYSPDPYASDVERTKQREWILRDGNALFRLNGHPNIVRAHPPFPWESNRIVLPLDWVDGYSLRALIDAKELLTQARKLDIARQVCQGLNFAHKHGVIHRDVRPDNVIVPREGDVKLVNFDCARIEGGDMATIASRVGRRLDERYVAPEVWENAAAASRASEVYSLGILLFELLTNQTPYAKIRELFAGHGLPHKPTELKPDLSQDVDELIAETCAFDPEARPKTLDAVIELIDFLD